MSTDGDDDIVRQLGQDDGIVRQIGQDDGIVRQIGHDEFDPIGTAWLILVYFIILVGMWVFTYFVEFLGRGPTIVG